MWQHHFPWNIGAACRGPLNTYRARSRRQCRRLGVDPAETVLCVPYEKIDLQGTWTAEAPTGGPIRILFSNGVLVGGDL